MKLSTVMAVICLTGAVIMFNTAHATGYGFGGSSANAGAVALSGSASNASANNNQGGQSVDIDNKRPFPNGTAIGAASSNTTAPFRYLDSTSTSVLFFAHSSTRMKFDIVTFVMSSPTDEVIQAACFAEDEYKAYRAYINNPCLEN